MPDYTPDCDPHKTFGVYQIHNVATGWVYIGSTTQRFSYRWRQHIKDLKDNKHDNHYLQHSWNRWGPIWFQFEIVEVLTSKNVVIEREQFVADKMRGEGVRLYNTNVIVANPMQGKHHTEETKEKIRVKATGRKVGRTWNKGRTSTSEERKALSIAIRRSMTRPEVKENLSKGQTGRKHSEESKRKRSEAFKGDKNPTKRPEVALKISAAHKAKRLGDQLTHGNYLILAMLDSRADGVQPKEMVQVGVPYNSLNKMLGKLLRLCFIEKDTSRRYNRYFITEAGRQQLSEYHSKDGQ